MLLEEQYWLLNFKVNDAVTYCTLCFENSTLFIFYWQHYCQIIVVSHKEVYISNLPKTLCIILNAIYFDEG